jgi:hypothetical protein
MKTIMASRVLRGWVLGFLLTMLGGIGFGEPYHPPYPTCSDGESLYVAIPDGKVYQIMPDGSWSIYGERGVDWAVTGLAVVNDVVYAIDWESGDRAFLREVRSGKSLIDVDLNEFGESSLPAGLMTGYNGFLYILKSNRLYKVNPETSSYEVLGGADWAPPYAITSWGNSLYILQNNRLQRVDPDTGDWEVLGEADWAPPFAITSLGFFVYVLQNSRLHMVDPNTGEWRVLGEPSWDTKEGFYPTDNRWSITGHKGDLWILHNRIPLRVGAFSGEIQ